MVFEVADDQACTPRRAPLGDDDTLGKAQQLVGLGIEMVVCGAISMEAQHQLQASGIRVIGFVTGELDAVIEALLQEDLPNARLSMPGCGRRGVGAGLRRRFRGGRASPKPARTTRERQS